MARTAPYGSWSSPISAELLVQEAVGLSQVLAADGYCYWNELRPSEGARNVLMRRSLSGTAEEELLPEGYSARSLVHEYGGLCYALHGGELYFSNFSDQRLYRLRPGGEPRPITEAPAVARAVRYADPVVTPDGAHVICVRERHQMEGVSGASGVENDLVAVPTDGLGPVTVLAEGHDFYAAPRLSPDGRRLAYLTWDDPHMPWDESAVYLGELDSALRLVAPRLVAGGPGISISQPRFSPEGVLHYLSDDSGFWNLYDEEGSGLAPLPAEFGGPDWVFGQSSFAFTPTGRLLAVCASPGGDELGVIEKGAFSPLPLEYKSVHSLAATEEGVVALCGSPTLPLAVVAVAESGRSQVLRESRAATVAVDYLSVPRAIEFPTTGGGRAHALFYGPRNAEYIGPFGARPPLIVQSHGGPTAQASALFDLKIQFWTSRGFAVVDVDYRGSTGYGRAYREELAGGWGIADVEDCIAAARHLAKEGRVDRNKLVIHGGSAGGFTTLCALTFHRVFAAGASYYGVSDLSALARDTHKFEANYLEKLVGPYPAAAETYAERSPIHHAEQLSSPVIFFQGMEDAVVPPAQTEEMYDALRRRGIATAYLAFPGEQHGFRRAETIIAVAEAELSFYAQVLGFTPADEVPKVAIANRTTLIH
ncbi:MAG TPA: S9 family peptidase [Acidimicrobiales bacterium]|nr:S9 family peptidase [Acidimicrobiales bacterium]